MRSRGRLTAVFLGAVTALLLSAGAGAHGLGGPWVQVPGATIFPGEPYELWGADFGPHATVDIALSTGDRTYPAGEVTAGADGHFTTSIAAPEALPAGFVELTATTEAGLSSSVWVQVGRGSAAASPAAWWMDPSVLVLGVLVIGGLIAIGLMLIRRRTAQPATAPRRLSARRG
jgi:hypothetical protein